MILIINFHFYAKSQIQETLTTTLQILRSKVLRNRNDWPLGNRKAAQ